VTGFGLNNSFTEKCENCTAREPLPVLELGSFLLLRGGDFGDKLALPLSAGPLRGSIYYQLTALHA